MIDMTSNSQSQSPSAQLSAGMNSNWNQSLSNVALQQRGMPNQSFQATPSSSSMSQNFPGIGNLSLQHGQSQAQPPPQGSPNAGNRNMGAFSLGQRGVLPQLPGQNIAANVNQIRRPGMPTSSSILSSSSNSSSMSTMSFMSSFNRQNTENTTVLDPSDLNHFPTLGNRGGMSTNPTTMSKSYEWRQWSAPRPRPQETQPDFTIQPEDFPALPGAQNPPTSSATENGRKSPSANSTGNFGPYEQAVRDSRQQQNLSNNTQKRGLQTLPDGTVTNIPPGMVSDQFGMAGLLTFIQTAETDQNLVALNPGIDLTTLGLNLTSMETLYSTFQSPWADSPCRPQDIDFHVPSEYLTNIFIREKLAPIKLNRYGDDLLFFLYYMNGNDVLQLAAAAELYNRDWRCHKEERVWITRPAGMEPMVKTNTYERGTYYFFDVTTWRRVAKEFHLEYEKLEERPHLPANIASTTPPVNPQQQPAPPGPQQHLLHNAVQQQPQGPLSGHS